MAVTMRKKKCATVYEVATKLTHLLASSPPGGRLGMASDANVRITWTKSGRLSSPCFLMISVGKQNQILLNCVTTIASKSNMCNSFKCYFLKICVQYRNIMNETSFTYRLILSCYDWSIDVWWWRWVSSGYHLYYWYWFNTVFIVTLSILHTERCSNHC